MHSDNYNRNFVINHVGYMGEKVVHHEPRQLKQPVYLEGATYYKKYSGSVRRVAPAPNAIQAFEPVEKGSVYTCMRPMLFLMKALGIFPVTINRDGEYVLSPILGAYSAAVFLVFAGYIGYMRWDKVKLVKSAEERFEEAVIDYLFTVYLLPLIMVPMAWFETRKITTVFNDWAILEKYYRKAFKKNFVVNHNNVPLLITLVLPVISCASMVLNHVTMAHVRVIQVVPYCYINTITYVVGGVWYLHCYVIGHVSVAIADEFELALKNIGPSSMVAHFRSIWMILSKICKGVGVGLCYQLTFLCLYMFLIITLTIYGLLSQIQEGFGSKDIGLAITAAFAIALLYYLCDEAHYSSNQVKEYFQRKLLLVELSWMNDNAQQEINMFLRATEMNPSDMSLGGFFDVNRRLFKSLLATMVTYLVVLLQFQISIPDDHTYNPSNTTALFTAIFDITTAVSL